jgi:LacI family repressor for deo operon, udp, cdd, tsx, nupC, and nupG
MRDVANLARVGLSTVSRAFSEPERVARATLDRIETAVAKLNYVPNATARTLRARQTGRVLVMIPAIGNTFFAPILDGIEEVAAAAHRVILLGDSHRGVGLTRSYTSRSYMTQLAAGRADALILLDGSLPIVESEGDDRVGEPVVAVSEPSFAEFVPYVGIDNRQAAFDMSMYLGELGHRHFAFISGRDGSTTATAREQGFRDAMRALGVQETDFIVVHGDFTINSGEETLRRVRDRSVFPTALFCSNDDIAAVVMHELRRIDMRVPDDVSVSGIDDVEVSRLLNPGLTTIRQPRYEMGRTGMQMIVNQLEHGTERAADVVLPHRLVVRDSTGRPRAKL